MGTHLVRNGDSVIHGIRGNGRGGLCASNHIKSHQITSNQPALLDEHGVQHTLRLPPFFGFCALLPPSSASAKGNSPTGLTACELEQTSKGCMHGSVAKLAGSSSPPCDGVGAHMASVVVLLTQTVPSNSGTTGRRPWAQAASS